MVRKVRFCAAPRLWYGSHSPTTRAERPMFNSSTLVIALAAVMLVILIALVLLWAITEELPRGSRIPFYERLEPGEWSVQLVSVGRRKARAMRVVNEVLGGDIGAAKAAVDHPPATIVESINEGIAFEIVEALADAGAEAVAVRQ